MWENVEKIVIFYENGSVISRLLHGFEEAINFEKH